jgi:hypothetical protein
VPDGIRHQMIFFDEPRGGCQLAGQDVGSG